MFLSENKVRVGTGQGWLSISGFDLVGITIAKSPSQKQKVRWAHFTETEPGGGQFWLFVLGGVRMAG